MRRLLTAAGSAALLGLASGQVSGKFVDPLTGFTFSQYHNNNGITFGLAIPANIAANTPYDTVIQLTAKTTVGWYGLAWGGTMTYNPIALAHPNGNGVSLTSRMAFGNFLPPAYNGATYDILPNGTFSNATHWQVTAKCTGCSRWGDDSLGATYLDPSQNHTLAWAMSSKPVDDPTDPNTGFEKHEQKDYFLHSFSDAVNVNFEELLAKNSGGSGGGGYPTPSSSTVTASEPQSECPVPPPTDTAAATSAASFGTTTTTSSATTTRPTSATSFIPKGVTQQTPPALLLPFPTSCSGVPPARFPYSLRQGWRATKVGGNLTTPRGLAFDTLGNLLVVHAGQGVSAYTFGPDGCINGTSVVIALRGLNHGIAMSPDGKRLYASSITTAWGWDYDAATRTVSNQTVVVKGMHGRGHSTRALWLAPRDPETMLIQVGSDGNWDYESADPAVGRSAIRGFDLRSVPEGGHDYVQGGFQMGYGMRNAVGLAFDPNGDAWEVENSGDNFMRTVNGVETDIHHENPAEELNYLGDPTKPNNNWYGYPTCFTVWDPSVFRDTQSLRTGDQFVPSPNSTLNDTSCASAALPAVPPRLAFPAHSAPISALFDAQGRNLYVTFHGSWNRDPPTGFKVVQVPFWQDGQSGLYGPTARADSREGYRDVMWSDNVEQCSELTCLRPAGLAWDPARSRLVVGSDNSREGEMFLLAPVNWF